jgi:hypothetical protein
MKSEKRREKERVSPRETWRVKQREKERAKPNK